MHRLERGLGALRSERLRVDRPVVIRLITYVRIPRHAHRRKITHRAVLARDSWTCPYCGARTPSLAVDPLAPPSPGRQRARASTVLPTPGTSSIRI